MQEVEKKWK